MNREELADEIFSSTRDFNRFNPGDCDAFDIIVDNFPYNVQVSCDSDQSLHFAIYAFEWTGCEYEASENELVIEYLIPKSILI